ncbi:MAG: D-tyrosyl-tRNA(Tyr) deacylase [Bacteroidetes bacterium]|nr:MAG: D-tyrosyl-tRNA(Tyr) deacylase [Bacteroidota bacterium]
MRVLIQRVSQAAITADGIDRGNIGKGLLVLVGIEEEDTSEDIAWLCAKICNLRVFPDVEGVMNLSLLQEQFELAVVSQFTLHASTKKGNRPSYIRAARPETAIPLYGQFIEELTRLSGKEPVTGVFGANMQVSLVNDGPVTLFIDSKNRE